MYHAPKQSHGFRTSWFHNFKENIKTMEKRQLEARFTRNTKKFILLLKKFKVFFHKKNLFFKIIYSILFFCIDWTEMTRCPVMDNPPNNKGNHTRNIRRLTFLLGWQISYPNREKMNRIIFSQMDLKWIVNKFSGYLFRDWKKKHFAGI